MLARGKESFVIPADKTACFSPSLFMELSQRTPLVMVLPLEEQFEAPTDLTLLEAAGFAAIRLPRSCRNGTCRACMCKMLSGTVSYRIEWPGLTKEEKGEGWILPCVACAESDLVIEVPEAEMITPK